MADFDNPPEVPAIQVTKTDTIEARYAQLPVTDLHIRFLVQMMVPVAMVPIEYVLPPDFTSTQNKLDRLKEKILDRWRKQFKNHKREMTKSGQEWVFDVNKVELIECDLLIPKKTW